MSTKLATAFLDRIQRSGLVSPDEMPRLRQQLQERGVDLGDPHAIAESLVALDVVTRWQADKILEGKHKGFFLGSYRLLRPLGKGGMGAVFLATHEMMRRLCAIKVLPHSQIKEGSSVLKRFYVEAQAVAALDHQNIVRAYDVNMESKDGKDIHYLVMEYVEGQDVQGLVQDHGLMDYIRAAEYLRQTANGLAHAHENGLVHRDIKPANLLVDKKGVVKVLDLGLARFFDDSEAASLTTAHNETVLGTADYLSPEQALNSHTVDHRTDIYSLGCTAYFMLTGHPPFPEGSVAQRLIAHQVRMPDPITDQRPDAPADLLSIIGKMMAKNPDDRYQTADELSAVLAKWLIEHGDDEWKRQHSEIVADRALISLLASREPTRAMSASMSETELELAPLDDDPDHVITSPDTVAPVVRKPDSAVRSGSGRKSGAGSGKSGSAARSPRKRGDSSATRPPAEAARPRQPRNEPALENLTSDDMFGHDPLGALGGVDLGQLDEGDMLGALDHHDLMGVGIGDAPGGAMDSDLRQVTLSGGQPIVSKSQRKLGAQSAKTSWFAANAIGLPILIGSAGGLLVVLIILAVIFMSNQAARRSEPTSPEADQQSRSVRSPAETGQETSPPAEEPEQISETAAEHERSAPKKSIARSDAPRQKQKSPPPPASQAEPDRSEPSDSGREPQGQDARSSVPVAQAEPEPAADPRPATEPAGVQQVQPAAEISRQEPAAKQPPAEKPAAKQPPVRQSPQELLAGLEAVKLDAKPPAGGGRKYTGDVQKVLGSTIAAIDRGTVETLKDCGIVIDDSAKAVLTLQLDTLMQPQGMVLQLRGRLTAPDAAGEIVELWAHEEELVRLASRFTYAVVWNVTRENVNKFFQNLRAQHQRAKQPAEN